MRQQIKSINFIVVFTQQSGLHMALLYISFWSHNKDTHIGVDEPKKIKKTSLA